MGVGQHHEVEIAAFFEQGASRASLGKGRMVRLCWVPPPPAQEPS